MGISYAQSKSGYHVSKKILIGGEGGWDYLKYDVPSHRLFVSHSDRVVVVNTDSGKVVGEILKTEGIHGVALANEFGRGFTTNGRASTVSIFDLKTLEVLNQVPVGKNPDASLYDTFTHRVFIFNGRSNDATVLDAAQGTVVSTIPLGGKPEAGVSDEKGRVYVNIEDKNEVVVIDSKSMTPLARWSLNPGESPSGLAIDLEHHRLFAGCGNKLMIVLDADSGKVLASLPIGRGVDGCAYDPGTGLAFASNGDGTLTIVREESPSVFSVLDNVPTQSGARTLTLDPITHTLYLATAEFGPAPEPTAENPRPRRTILPNSFVVLQIQQ
jgi:YVTN family beta-propeller protein